MNHPGYERNVDRFLAAAVQLRVGSDKAANLALAERLVRQAADRGARLVALPELFFWNGPKDRELEAAETIPGPTTAALGKLAHELDIVLIGGSILEKTGEHAKAGCVDCHARAREGQELRRSRGKTWSRHNR